MTLQAGVITVELVDGTKVIVPDSLENITSYVLREQGDWFEDEIRFLRALMQPGETVVDIGANYGVYSLSLARKVGPSGQLWAFEPASETAALLKTSAVANGTSWLHVVQQALSDREGTAWLQMPGHAELNSLGSSEGGDADRGLGETVPLTTLDCCLESFGWTAIDLLKIDAEGEEKRIINGGARFFQELSPLVMFEVKSGTELHLELVQCFAKLGYQCFRLIPGLNALAPFSVEQGVDGYLLNLFAVKPDRAAALASAGWLVQDETPEPVPAEELVSCAWQEGLQHLSDSQDLASPWQDPPVDAGQLVIQRALAAWSLSQDAVKPIAFRFAALTKSHELLKQQCTPGCPPERWASLARVALALGERVQAVQAMSLLLKELQAGSKLDLQEPFLCPDHAFDTIEATGKKEGWLEGSTLVALERSSSFSGYYTGENAYARLERVFELGYPIECIQRRAALVNARFARVVQSNAPVSDSAGGGDSPSLNLGAPVQLHQPYDGDHAELRIGGSTSWGGGYYTGLTYGCYSFRELAPNWIDFALLSQRQRPPRVGGEGSPFQYLELGSGMGLGLCLLAAAYPEGQFIGIDFHPSHISHSQLLVAELGLTNVSFHEADFLELAADGTLLPFAAGLRFHYVVAHGILSWIAPHVRAALLQLAGTLLRPGGAFYASYNTFPGWLDRTAFKALADLERQRLGSANLSQALERAGSSLARLLQFSTRTGQALPQLADQLGRIRQINQVDYLCGEYGAEHWKPFYVGEVHQLASVYKLSYAASANLPENFPSLLQPMVADLLAAEGDPTIRQALQDLAINQSFRRDIFVKGPLSMTRVAQEQRLSELCLRATGHAGANSSLECSSTSDWIETSLGAIVDDSGRLQRIEVLLADHPASLAELQQALVIPPEDLVVLTSLLLHAGRTGLDRGDAGISATASCSVVNARLMALMQGGYNLGYLAAPAVGHGAQPFGLIDCLVLEGLRQGLDGEVLSGCVLLGLRGIGAELLGPDVSPLNDADAIKYINGHIIQFRDATLPVLVRHGISDPLG